MTAIVAGDDLMMLGIVSALERHGLQVRRDTSVAGFGDSDEIRSDAARAPASRCSA